MGGVIKFTTATIAGALLANSVNAKPVVDTVYPYTGPAVPVGDWVDGTVNGNGKGFPRLVEPPAVKPALKNPTNNINVISVAYAGSGVNIHYQTPFGLGADPEVKWGSSSNALENTQTGSSHSYDRTPPCSQVVVTQCSQHFHEVQLANLKPDTTYYYKISAANGTTASDILSFTTARDAGSKKEFTVAILNDMGYTNAGGTYRELNKAVDDGAAFAWHGGDISYADDWYSGILPCESSWPVCYNGTSTELPGGNVPPEYDVPLPKGEVANQGGPQGGDMSVLYESNWDLWQQWTNSITTKVPYMVLPGNHEASCGEFDGPGNVLTAYLNNNQTNSTAPKSALTYYSCPPSQRNYTAYQHRFRMPGAESGGVGNFWYSFDYGLAHFISFNGETDYPYSPEWPFSRDLKGGETHPKESETFITDSGPFGAVTGSIYVKESYEQYNWLAEDLKRVDRTKTPWVIAMSHRPMYSSQVSSYQKNMRNAFEALFLEYGVDLYLSGHIHWYERTLPLGPNGTIDQGSVVNHNTYYTNEGKSMAHLINGMAGNIESHSTIPLNQTLNITKVLNQADYGFSKLKIVNETFLSWDFVKGADGSIGDSLTLIKRASVSSTTTSAGASTATSTATSIGSSATSIGSSATSIGSSAGSSTGSSATTPAGTSPATSCDSTGTTTGTAATSSSTGVGGVVTVTDIVTAYTTFCPAATTVVEGNKTYTVTEATTLTITNCPCTRTYTTTATGPAGVTPTPSAPAGSAAPSLQGGNSVPVASSGSPKAPQGSSAQAATSPPAEASQSNNSLGSGIQGTAPGSSGSATTLSAPPAVGAGFRGVASTSVVGLVAILATMAMF